MKIADATIVIFQPIFKNTGVPLIVLAALAFIEYYCFTTNTAFRSVSGLTRIIIKGVYLLLSVAIIYTVFSIRHWETGTWNPAVRTLVISLFMGIIVAKLRMTLVMGADNLRRLIVWVGQKIAAKPTLVADNSSGAFRLRRVSSVRNSLRVRRVRRLWPEAWCSVVLSGVPETSIVIR